MKLGISSGCWYPALTEESAEKIFAAGYKTAEIFICDESECTPEFLAKLKERLDRYGIQAVSVHPYTSFAEQFLFFSGYRRREETAYGYYRKYHTACRILGAKVINFHGATSPIAAERYAEIYQRLYLEAKEEGLFFCQENVRKFRSGKAAFLKELKDLLGDGIAFTLDVKQALMEGEDPTQMMRLMGSNLKLVHISDHTEAEPCLLPGYGSFDLRGFVNGLKGVGYNGYLITEVYSSNYRSDSEIANSHKHLQEILNTAEG